MCGRSRCRYNSKVTRAALELELYFILIQGGLPMTFPEIVKTTLWDIIDEMSRSLSSFVDVYKRQVLLRDSAEPSVSQD